MEIIHHHIFLLILSIHLTRFLWEFLIPSVLHNLIQKLLGSSYSFQKMRNSECDYLFVLLLLIDIVQMHFKL